MIISEDKNKIISELIDGKVIAIKTDTVYGLICDALNKSSVSRIYDIKNRETKKPISIFVKDIDYIKKIVDENFVNEKAYKVMKEYWPGALTVILKKKKDVLDYLTCGLDSIGIRIPNDIFLMSLLKDLPFPLAETSCNISGEKEYKNPQIIFDKLGKEVDYIVDGGEIKNNVASTVVSFINDNIKIIRQGDIYINEKY